MHTIVGAPALGANAAPSRVHSSAPLSAPDGGQPPTPRPARPLDTCVTSPRVSVSAGQSVAPEAVPETFGCRFPTADRLDVAAGSLQSLEGWRGQEGPRFRITLGPGCITVGHKDLARAERTAERAQNRDRMNSAQMAREAGTAARQRGGDWVSDDRDWDEESDVDPVGLVPEMYGKYHGPRDGLRQITGWSRRSRARLFHATGELDYTPMLVLGQAPVMTTLTYAENWLDVAPTGKASKKHLEAFYMRFERAWGVSFIGLWKEEFQRRGAPHYHLWHPRPQGLAGALRRLTAVRYRPAAGDGLEYDEWVRTVWADIVRHPNAEDYFNHQRNGACVSEIEDGHVNTPMKLAGYFAKHGAFMAKDYQNKVPEAWRAPGKGPGRFWGYKGLEREVRVVDVAPVDAVRAARILRKLAARERVWDQAADDGRGAHRWVKAVRQVRVKRGVRAARGHWVVQPSDGRRVWRPDWSTGEVKPRYRVATRPVTRFASGSGFLCLDDAPTTLVNIARALEIQRA